MQPVCSRRSECPASGDDPPARGAAPTVRGVVHGAGIGLPSENHSSFGILKNFDFPERALALSRRHK